MLNGKVFSHQLSTHFLNGIAAIGQYVLSTPVVLNAGLDIQLQQTQIGEPGKRKKKIAMPFLKWHDPSSYCT